MRTLLLVVRWRVSIGVWLVVLETAGLGLAAPLERGPLLDRGALSTPTMPSVLAVSGRALVASAPASQMSDPQGMGAAYVYEKSRPLWSNEAPVATLVSSDAVPGDGFGRAVAISGSEIAVRANDAVYVYSEPPGGWSGVLRESAKLVVPAGHASFPDVLAMTGSMVAVVNDDGVHVFRRPDGGWSGVITGSAVLSAGDRFMVAAVALSDRAITAVGLRGRGGNGAPIVEDWSVDTFRPGAGGGWSGVISPTARVTLVHPRHVLMSGAAFTARTVVVLGSDTSNAVAAYRFAEPKAGWAGSVHAFSKTPNLLLGSPDDRPALSVSATRVMLDFVGVSSGIVPNTVHTLTVFDKPAGGWPSVIPATATSPALQSAGDATLDGDELLLPLAASPLQVGARYGIAHFLIEPPAEVTRAELGGVTRRRPRMRTAVRSGAGGAPFSRVSITLPHGLRLTSQQLTRMHLSISPRAARPSVSSTHHRITITLTRPTRAVALTLTAGAISTESHLTRELARLQLTANRRHRATHLALSLPVRATDTAGITTSRSPAITLTLRPHR